MTRLEPFEECPPWDNSIWAYRVTQSIMLLRCHGFLTPTEANKASQRAKDWIQQWMKTKKPYEIGDEIWYAGGKVTITTTPYKLYGAYWQDAVDTDGNVKTIVSGKTYGGYWID